MYFWSAYWYNASYELKFVYTHARTKLEAKEKIEKSLGQKVKSVHMVQGSSLAHHKDKNYQSLYHVVE